MTKCNKVHDMTAHEVMKRTQAWTRTLARKTRRTELRRVIEEKDHKGLFTYCFMRAFHTDMMSAILGVALIGQGIVDCGIKENERRVRLAYRQYWRICKWWKI